MHFHIITLFPKAFDSYLSESILKRAIENKKIKVSFYNPRDFVKNKWKKVDRPPSGEQFTNNYAAKVAKKYKHVVIICGRYEGVDARVKKVFKVDEISIGPFVST